MQSNKQLRANIFQLNFSYFLRVPAPGRATKGQKVSWQSPESRIESIHLNTETPRSNFMSPSHVYPSPAPSLSTARDEKIMKEIQNYEKRIQGLINGVGLLKEHVISVEI